MPKTRLSVGTKVKIVDNSHSAHHLKIGRICTIKRLDIPFMYEVKCDEVGSGVTRMVHRKDIKVVDVNRTKFEKAMDELKSGSLGSIGGKIDSIKREFGSLIKES